MGTFLSRTRKDAVSFRCDHHLAQTTSQSDDVVLTISCDECWLGHRRGLQKGALSCDLGTTTWTRARPRSDREEVKVKPAVRPSISRDRENGGIVHSSRCETKHSHTLVSLAAPACLPRRLFMFSRHGGKGLGPSHGSWRAKRRTRKSVPTSTMKVVPVKP